MLRQRVITALVLLALLLPALFASSPLPFALFTLVLISAAGWEWARLNGLAAPLLSPGEPPRVLPLERMFSDLMTHLRARRKISAGFESFRDEWDVKL